jgi:hypothetical protein
MVLRKYLKALRNTTNHFTFILIDFISNVGWVWWHPIGADQWKNWSRLVPNMATETLFSYSSTMESYASDSGLSWYGELKLHWETLASLGSLSAIFPLSVGMQLLVVNMSGYINPREVWWESGIEGAALPHPLWIPIIFRLYRWANFTSGIMRISCVPRVVSTPNSWKQYSTVSNCWLSNSFSRYIVAV